jgi:hypothetical protein
MRCLSRLVITCVCAVMFAPASIAQTSDDKSFSSEELEQIVAPIALYPDALIAQVLMAATYPLEVVSAARWVKSNPDVNGKALEDAMQKQPWDPAVKSLTAFPQVLDMMNGQLDWTQKLGDAFLAQQKDVMAAIQTLRTKADAAGNLQSTKEQVVTKETVNNTTVVKIEPADPQVVYVPTYNPTVVYGAWPYPASPPYAYYPPAYTPGAALFTFGVGMAVGAALWGDCDWGRGDVNINTNNYNNFNRTNVQNKNWEHKAEHRKGVGYRDNATRERYGRGQQPGADSREAFRGRAEQGRSDIAGGAADRMRGERAGERGGRGDGGIGERGGRGDGGTGERRASAGGGERRDGAMRQTSATRDGGGFQGVGGRGAETRDFSDRGAASRSSAGTHRAAAGGSAGARAGGGGGGARAGGGGGGGGGGRGGGGRR